MIKKLIRGVAIACSICIATIANSLANDSTGTLKPIKVEMRKTDQGFVLMRDGANYFIKGAGGANYLNRIAEYGGNSVRTWTTANAGKILNEAHKHGLTVLLGLELKPERHGFDYNDSVAVKKQFEIMKADVIKYKDHPALLAWGLGNELNLFYKNPQVWDAVNDIAEMIHELDPNHPTTTVLAGLNKSEVDYIKTKAPAVDILSINTYAGLPSIPQQIIATGWEGPYMITEWGPTGHWECQLTEWKAPIEETSSQKAVVYKNRYSSSVEKDKNKCLGSYVFLWGQKQERTPTWYGLFTDKGEESEVVDVIHYLWSGAYPSNKAPYIDGLQLDNKKANQSIYLKAGTKTTADAFITDPDGDKLTYRWEILHEPTKVGDGGDHEDRPEAAKWQYKETGKGKISFTVPDKTGAYRLFIYAKDGKNNIATANIPFFIK